MPDQVDEAALEGAAALLLDRLAERGLSLASAESLTGGMFAAAVTAVPGASAVYRGGVIAYASRLKHDLLGVDADLIASHGVINPEVARAMAQGVRERTGADLAVSCTGVAGPDRQDDAEVGTVFIAVAAVGDTTVAQLALAGDRASIRRHSVAAMLSLVDGRLG